MTMEMILGPRLCLVATQVPEGALLGDIGTDHAYLPIYLWEKGIIRHAVAVDVHEGPYLSARSAVASRHLEQAIEVRFGDGLRPVQPGEVDTLTLAGMGGNTMLEIFVARPEVMAQVQTLVLQPQGSEGKVRLRLLQEGWRLRREQLVEEEDRIYVVMNYSREEGFTYQELQARVVGWFERLGKIGQFSQTISELINKLIWDFGPLVFEQPGPELRILLDEQIQSIARVTQEMQKSNQIKVQERIQYFELTGTVLEEMKKCLFPSA